MRGEDGLIEGRRDGEREREPGDEANTHLLSTVQLIVLCNKLYQFL